MTHNKLKLPSCTYMYFKRDDIFKQKEKPNHISVEKEVYETVLKNNCDLMRETERLKKLLLKCQEYLPEWTTPMDILAEIDEAIMKIKGE